MRGFAARGVLGFAGVMAVLAWGPKGSGHEQPRPPLFRGGVEVVHVGVTVTDREGRLVAALGADDFEVYEDGVRQQVQLFAPGADPDQPLALHVGLLLDVSQSMVQDLAFTRSAAIRFLNSLPDAEDFTVVDFDTEIRAARFGQADFPRLVERIRQQNVRGWTALYDAVGVYLDGAAEQSGRKIMLLYTDGGDTRSTLRFRELLDLLRASDVTVYAVGALQNQPSSARQQQRLVLHQIAEVTGGLAFFPMGPRDLDRAYEQVLAEIRAQYTLGYESTNLRADGRWRKVDIRLSRPESRRLRVRARPGYFGLLAPEGRAPDR